MLKKTITYVDYNENERTEDFYFNLTQSELTEMELSQEGGLKNKLEKIIAAQDKGEIMRMFKEIILKAYGEKSEDGRRFIKSEEISTAFSQTEAYNKLFTELLSDEGKASAFVNGIVPSNLAEEIEKMKKE